MKEQKPWAQALDIKPDDYQLWVDQVPKGGSLTFWCLSKNKISTETYMNWAREFYGLAMLNEEFFRQPVNHQLWNMIQSVANWSADLLPITEWDGVIFVACVEPPQEVNWSFPVRYLLASPQSLNQYWQQLQSPQSVVATPETPAQPSAQLVEAAPSMDAAPLVEAVPLVDTEAPVAAVAAESEKTQEKTQDAPMGLSLNLSDLPPPEVATSTATADIPSAEVPPAEEENSMPEGFSLNLDGAENAPQPLILEGLDPQLFAQENTSQENSAQETTGIDHSTDESADSPMVIMGGTESFTEQGEKDEPHPLDALPDVPAGLVINADNENAEPQGKNFRAFMSEESLIQHSGESVESGDADNVSTLTPRLKTPEHSFVNTSAAPSELSSAQSENDVFAWGFKSLKEQFSCSMFLSYSDEHLTPWKWETGWTPREESALQPINTEVPSIFRIVKRTSLPYHGHITPSDTNRDFFANWGMNSLPSHATIIPFIIEGQFVGELLCIGEAASNTDEALRLAEKTVTQMASQLSKVQMQAA